MRTEESLNNHYRTLLVCTCFGDILLENDLASLVTGRQSM